jgi:hypothetical protein
MSDIAILYDIAIAMGWGGGAQCLVLWSRMRVIRHPELSATRQLHISLPQK